MAVKLRRVIIIAARFRSPCPEQATPQETRAVLTAWAPPEHDQPNCETRASGLWVPETRRTTVHAAGSPLDMAHHRLALMLIYRHTRGKITSGR
jgi:hypothetical protein